MTHRNCKQYVFNINFEWWLPFLFSCELHFLLFVVYIYIYTDVLGYHWTATSGRVILTKNVGPIWVQIMTIYKKYTIYNIHVRSTRPPIVRIYTVRLAPLCTSVFLYNAGQASKVWAGMAKPGRLIRISLYLCTRRTIPRHWDSRPISWSAIPNRVGIWYCHTDECTVIPVNHRSMCVCVCVCVCIYTQGVP